MMKLKNLLKFAILLFATLLIVSCDDNIDNIGESIQPEVDDILLDVDEVFLKAETVSLDNRFYIRTNRNLLGEIEDPVFKTLKADFLTEFYTSGNTVFEHPEEAITPISIDSVLLNMYLESKKHVGDSISPMGISVYEATTDLRSNFYTDINPLDFSDKKKLLGKRFFSVSRLLDTLGLKHLTVEFDKSFGRSLLKKWQDDPSVLQNSKNLKEYFKGIYVTADFDTKTLLEIYQTEINIYYTYSVRNAADSEDSTVYRVLPLPATLDVLQMNRVVNSPLSEVEGYKLNDIKSYTKSPSGIVTKLTIPLAEIRKKAKEKTHSDKYTINSAKFKLVGMTEEEDKLKIANRPQTFLFVNKDSIENFFFKEKMTDAITSMILVRDADNNTYNFAYGNTYSTGYGTGIASSGSFTNNIAGLINHYLNKEIETETEIESLEYYVIPVSTNLQALDSYGTSWSVTGINNYFTPATSIFRTSKDFMKMSLIFSKHNPKPTE